MRELPRVGEGASRTPAVGRADVPTSANRSSDGTSPTASPPLPLPLPLLPAGARSLRRRDSPRAMRCDASATAAALVPGTYVVPGRATMAGLPVSAMDMMADAVPCGMVGTPSTMDASDARRFFFSVSKFVCRPASTTASPSSVNSSNSGGSMWKAWRSTSCATAGPRTPNRDAPRTEADTTTLSYSEHSSVRRRSRMSR